MEDLDNEEVLSPVEGTRAQFTLDSIFLYAKQVYLWNDILPDYKTFNPRDQYNGILTLSSAYKKELFDISQIKINALTGNPYELGIHLGVPKYSFITPGRGANGGTLGGINTDSASLIKNVILSNNKVIAYLALSSFPTLNKCQNQLDKAFKEFEVAGSDHIIIDLRYNAGGYVETAEYLANLIAPKTLTGKIMYSEQFNSTLQNSKGTILRHQTYLDEQGKTVIYNGKIATMADVDYTEKGNTYRFSKKGGLEGIHDIYIIVSGQTASASELLISCLKPYFNVKLVGERTYGKPVGFFGISIDQYSVYLSSFLIKNASGWSDYFSGIDPDIEVIESLNPILGDPEELCIKASLLAIDKSSKDVGNKKATILKRNSNFHSLSILSPVLENEGLIENRLKLK